MKTKITKTLQVLTLCISLSIIVGITSVGCDLPKNERPIATTCTADDGTQYSSGESFNTQCGTCVCGDDGQLICTAQECETTCQFENVTYHAGDAFQNGCNTCTCESNGEVSCTSKSCGGDCEYNGQALAAGEKIMLGDGCGYCICLNGGIACTDAECGPVQCEVQGEVLNEGDTYTGDDGCSVCECGSSGTISCNADACACSPAHEYQRRYVANAEECAMMNQPLCPPNTEYFSNECGCGCEMSSECPEFVDCMPPVEHNQCSQEFMAQCPYTSFEQ